jgi:hypothetical protein
MKASKITREQWLENRAKLIAETIFRPAGYKVPRVRISIGFTGARGGLKVIGACWAPSAADDNVCQIFITPTQSDSTDVLAVLVHELIHATVGVDKGHGAAFKQCAKAVGLVGKMRSTTAGAELTKRLNALTKELGKIPHAKLNPALNGQKKQGTRLLKATCERTGYNVRIVKKWLEEYGNPRCGCCAAIMTVDGFEQENEE